MITHMNIVIDTHIGRNMAVLTQHRARANKAIGFNSTARGQNRTRLNNYIGPKVDIVSHHGRGSDSGRPMDPTDLVRCCIKPTG